MARIERLGKYELLRHLASGGMARVYLARVEGVGGFTRHMVLKTVRPERTEDSSYVAMFLDEARLIATLHHQHIAQVYDIGVSEDGTYFLAMEYLHGETVRHVLERARDLRQRLPLDFSLTIVAAAAAGLHHAHERRGPDGRPLGIVHRDVTPSNVIAGYDGSVKLIDFGIAKAAERSTQTKTGFIKGKAGYMAPEQALGHPVDRRADVFSLGVMLYELTTQTRAFPAASELEVAHRIVRGDVTPPSVAVTGYPSELEDVVMAALARDPDDRFGDADAFAFAVNHAASHLGVALGPASVQRVIGQLFGTRPEPWLSSEPTEEANEFSKTGDTASLLDSRPLLATSALSASAAASEAVGFARGTGAQQDLYPRSPTETVPPPPPTPSPPPAPELEIIDDDDEEADEMPTVKFVALDEAEIIIENAPGKSRVLSGQSSVSSPSSSGSIARQLAPLPGLTEPPPPGRIITTAPTTGVTPTPRPAAATVTVPPNDAVPVASSTRATGSSRMPTSSDAPRGPTPDPQWGSRRAPTIPPPDERASARLRSPTSQPIPSRPPRTPTIPPIPAAAHTAHVHSPAPSSSGVPAAVHGPSSGPVPVLAPSVTSGPIPVPTPIAISPSGPIPRLTPTTLPPPARPPMGSKPPPFESTPAPVAVAAPPAHHAPQLAPNPPLPPPVDLSAVSATPAPELATGSPPPTQLPVAAIGSPAPGARLLRPPTAPPSPIGMRTEEVMAFSQFEAKARRNKLLLPLLVGAALALVVIIVLVKVLDTGDETVTPAQPMAADPAPATTVPTPPAAPKTAPTETTTIKVVVTSDPPDATVMLDGERLGRTPITVERPRHAGLVPLKVRKKGYSTRKIEVDLGSDVTWDITLPKSK